jgi:hypothetical protein
MAYDGRERNVLGVVAPADLVVQRVDCGRVDSDADLTRVDRRDGESLHFERFRAAEAGQDNGLH